MNFEIEKLVSGLPREWSTLARDWDRSLRAGNYPATTRYNYLLAVVQLGRFLAPPADTGAGITVPSPLSVTKSEIEAFQAWMIETRSASTARNKHKGLQQFFRWLVVDEQELDRSPMERIREPKTPRKLVPIIRDVDTKRVLLTCKSNAFIDLRDEAVIRLLCNTGARLSEVANLAESDVDFRTDSVRYYGKGAKERSVRFGPKTGRALSRYLRARANHKACGLPALWLAERGGRALTANGIKLMLRRRGARAGVANLHAHRWRHNYAHEWKRAGGNTGDLMLLLGWTSEDMPRHYGASAAAERAQELQYRLGIGDNV